MATMTVAQIRAVRAQRKGGFMEIQVVFHGELPSEDELTRSMNELGFRFSTDPEVVLDEQGGFMPMRLSGTDTGCEFDVFEGRHTVEELAADDIDHIDPRADRCASFRFAGDMTERVSAACSAAALAKLVNGVVLGDMEHRMLTVEEVTDSARRSFDSFNAEHS
jgi:hypothetical protein